MLLGMCSPLPLRRGVVLPKRGVSESLFANMERCFARAAAEDISEHV